MISLEADETRRLLHSEMQFDGQQPDGDSGTRSDSDQGMPDQPQPAGPPAAQAPGRPPGPELEPAHAPETSRATPAPAPPLASEPDAARLPPPPRPQSSDDPAPQATAPLPGPAQASDTPDIAPVPVPRSSPDADTAQLSPPPLPEPDAEAEAEEGPEAEEPIEESGQEPEAPLDAEREPAMPVEEAEVLADAAGDAVPESDHPADHEGESPPESGTAAASSGGIAIPENLRRAWSDAELSNSYHDTLSRDDEFYRRYDRFADSLREKFDFPDLNLYELRDKLLEAASPSEQSLEEKLAEMKSILDEYLGAGRSSLDEWNDDDVEARLEAESGLSDAVVLEVFGEALGVLSHPDGETQQDQSDQPQAGGAEDSGSDLLAPAAELDAEESFSLRMADYHTELNGFSLFLSDRFNHPFLSIGELRPKLLDEASLVHASDEYDLSGVRAILTSHLRLEDQAALESLALSGASVRELELADELLDETLQYALRVLAADPRR